MRLRFTIRNLGLATIFIALTLGWFVDHKRLTSTIEQISTLVRPAATIAGTVTYLGSGKPAAGIRILAQTTSRRLASPVTPSPPTRRAEFGIARTDADGHYKFVDLQPANWNIFVDVDGWTAKAMDALPVVAGEEVKTADLQLVKGGFIKGSVIDTAGNPVAQAEGQRIVIGVYGPARPKSGPAIQAVYVDAKGRFRIRVPPGLNYPYISSVHPRSVVEGNEFEENGVTVVDGQTTDVEFRIKSSPDVRARPVFPPVQPGESEPADK